MPILDDIPKELPALQRAAEVQKRASEVGFDWKDASAILTKIEEELAELNQALKSQNFEKIAEELGDLFFTLVNLSRFLKIDSEKNLKMSVEKFTGRFKAIETELARQGKNIKKCSLQEMDAIWESLKRVKPTHI